MAFLNPDNILVTFKDTGIVRRILNGVMLQKPFLDVNIATYGYRGMLGIAISNNNSNTFGNDKFGTNNNCSSGISSPDNSNIISKYYLVYYTAATKRRWRRYYTR